MQKGSNFVFTLEDFEFIKIEPEDQKEVDKESNDWKVFLQFIKEFFMVNKKLTKVKKQDKRLTNKYKIVTENTIT